MGRPALPRDRVREIRASYRKTGNVSQTSRDLGVNRRTVMKYTEDLRTPVRDVVLVRAYRLTGSLDRVADLTGVHRVTVWRRLNKLGVDIGSGASDAAHLYTLLRDRCHKSDWRRQVLARDNHQCVRCGAATQIVHHLWYLADIRDEVFKRHPEVDPFKGKRSLNKFLRLVMGLHQPQHGVSLCAGCHKAAHKK